MYLPQVRSLSTNYCLAKRNIGNIKSNCCQKCKLIHFLSFPFVAEATSTPKLPYKVVGPLGGHPHPGPPAAYNPCPQPRYCDPTRCKDPIGCAPSCSETCCADILIPPPAPPVGSGAGPCPDACAPTYQPSCCMGAPPPMATQPFPQPVYPPMGPQPGFAPPAGYGQPVVIPQPPPGGCGQSCLATNCAPPCPPQCCRRKKSVIHHHDRKTRSLTSRFAMCH